MIQLQGYSHNHALYLNYWARRQHVKVEHVEGMQSGS